MPHELLLFVDASTHLDEEVADLAHDVFVLDLSDHLEELALDKVLSIRGKAGPQVSIVVLVSNVLGVSSVL